MSDYRALDWLWGVITLIAVLQVFDQSDNAIDGVIAVLKCGAYGLGGLVIFGIVVTLWERYPFLMKALAVVTIIIVFQMMHNHYGHG